jgi:hypothetical protein
MHTYKLIIGKSGRFSSQSSKCIITAFFVDIFWMNFLRPFQWINISVKTGEFLSPKCIFAKKIFLGLTLRRTLRKKSFYNCELGFSVFSKRSKFLNPSISTDNLFLMK